MALSIRRLGLLALAGSIAVSAAALAQVDAGGSPDAGPAPKAEGPADFAAEARLLYRIVACSGTQEMPAGIDLAAVEEHCKAMRPRMEKYRKKYAQDAEAFLASLRPANLPDVVVYPFGGGDLTSVLLTYPDAVEMTTISLEHAGDPRRIDGIDKAELGASLMALRRILGGLLVADNSTSVNLMKAERGEIPGQIAFFLVALAIHGLEPVSLKFFQLKSDGSIHYLTPSEIETLEETVAPRLKKNWTPPDASIAFSNSELTFRSAGAAPDAPLKVHRHIAFNLSDEALERDPSLIKHLEAKGRVCAMTKAASYLLWRSAFSKTRDYLLGHMEIMFSDSTGIPPGFATKAGFTMETYGHFERSFLGADPRLNADFKKLWDSQPERPLPFRYGYLDGSKRFHLVVTRRLVGPQ